MLGFTQENKKHLFSSVFPAIAFGAASGALSSVAVTLYKFFSHHIISLSEGGFLFFRKILWFFPFALPVLLGVSYLYSRILHKDPQLKGGGIPASVAALRGIRSLRPIQNAVGVFFLSLVSFLFGIPLGTEGPSVQMGTALGSAVVEKGPKKWRAWNRFSMTGGASAGFAVATGAPLSGILFSIEEAHGRISPLIVLVAISSVLSAELVTLILSPLLGVSTVLFSFGHLSPLSLSQLFLPLLLGLGMGLFAIAFLKGSRMLDRFLHQKCRFAPHIKIFFIFLFTAVFGLISFSFVSTGHDLAISLLKECPSLVMLLCLVLVRSFLTLGANSTGITGGIFLPLLAIGATVAAIFGKGLLVCGMSPELFPTVIALGICGCIAGMMQMPLTSILFSVEALGLSDNLVPVILTAAVSYALPSIMGEKSIGELVLEKRVAALNQNKVKEEGELECVIGENSFAVGKEIRDIFWPNGVFVLSVKKNETKGSLLSAGDTLMIRYTTCDPEKMKKELKEITES